MNKNSIIRFLIVLGVTGSASQGNAQGTFRNLGFESASIPTVQVGSLVPASEAMPDWNLYVTSPGGGSNSLSQVSYDGVSTGGDEVSIDDSGASPGFGPISGKYSAYLYSGNQGNVLFSVGISQTGLVPLGTESLQFQVGFATSPFIVTLGGQTINIVPLAAFSGYTEYGGDISAFAGQTQTLTFTETFPSVGAPPGGLSLDNIIFSTSPVPEPGTLALLVAGAALLGLRRRRKA
ncbi:MAG TPA: PEP-CTERM sorting domain-containing protein [Verrucomicrobiae bacterium]|jgi:hypothetical protein|nr:PEP-CTERM sorting domain-containing protein [Verrucomicrobiae bacterium]